jgi:hypothetical protein
LGQEIELHLLASGAAWGKRWVNQEAVGRRRRGKAHGITSILDWILTFNRPPPRSYTHTPFGYQTPRIPEDIIIAKAVARL